MADPTATTTGSKPVVPLFRCRRCRREAVRMIDGKRRTFYCEEHGPLKLADWTRLEPIKPPLLGYESAGRLLSITPPLPARVAKLLDAFVDSLREVLAQDMPAADVPDALRVQALTDEIARLTAALARVTEERDWAEEIANEALALLPPGDGEPEAVEGEEHRDTERDFPPPGPEPTPRAPSDAPSFPDPIMPERVEEPVPAQPRPKPGKGYTVHPKEPAAPVPVAERVPLVAPSGPRKFTAEEVNLIGLEALVRTIPAVPGAPGIRITRRALHDYAALNTDARLAVLDTLAFIGAGHVKLLREETLFSTDLVALRANRRWRLICEKEHGWYTIRYIMRADETHRARR